MKIKVLIILLIFESFANAAESNPQVTISLGKVKGSLMRTRLGKNINAFRGMRYGEAPIGPQRFKLAVPAKPWTGVFDASAEGPSCPQKGGKHTSDDCLRLNVYTTQLPGPGIDRRPVIVFIHPGSFHHGSGQSYLFGPSYLLDEPVVLVTLNHRLGAIGFTALGNKDSPGNLGLKDQVEALKWVRKNIEAFNGDRECVTIAGYSSGAWSVILHMLSPMSKNLFHRGIAMSGSPTKIIPLEHEQIEIAKEQATFVLCPKDNLTAMIKCFEKVPHETMSSTTPKFKQWHTDPIIAWSPVVEPDIPGLERFLSAQPVELIRRKDFNKVPLLIGSNLDEFSYQAMVPVVAARKGDNSIFDDLNKNWDNIAPIAFYFEKNTTKSKRQSAQLKKFYFKGQPIGLENWQSLGKLYADAVVLYLVNRAATLLSEYSNQPVYYYHFVYKGRFSLTSWPDTKKTFSGVAHVDDLMYLFNMKPVPFFNSTEPEVPTVKRMTAMWASFAKTGNPIPSSWNITWPPYDKIDKKYLEIANSLSVKANLNADRMNAFDTIFPIDF